MSKKQQKAKNNDLCIIIIIIIICLIAFNTFKQTTNNKNNSQDENIYDFEMLQQIVDNIHFDDEQAQNAVNIIKKIGINKITNIKSERFEFENYKASSRI